MIKCEKGQTFIAGNGIDILAEFTCVARGILETFTAQEIAKDVAKKVIKAAFDMAFEDEELFESEPPKKADALDAVEKLLQGILENLKGGRE